MAAHDVLVLNETTSPKEIQEIQSGDTYTMTADLSLGENAITAVEKIAITGEAATYTANPGHWNSVPNNHGYNWDEPVFSGVSMPAAISWTGTHTLYKKGYPISLGTLFTASGTVKNDSATSIGTLASFYTLFAAPTLQVDSQTVTQGQQVDMWITPTFNTTGASPSYTISDWSAILVQGSVSTGATVTNHHCFRAASPAKSGTITAQAGFTSVLTNATYNVGVLLGTVTIPVDAAFPNWGIYQESTVPNRWNGGHRQKYRAISGTTGTVTTADHYVICSNTGTVTLTLPTAVGCAGFQYIIKKTGASGTVNITSVSSQTFDGAASPLALSTQYHVARIFSNGANWLVEHVGAV